MSASCLLKVAAKLLLNFRPTMTIAIFVDVRIVFTF